MKKIVLLSLLIISLFSLKANGQTILNGGFENWNTLNFSDPLPWFDSNPQSISQFGVVTTTQVPGAFGGSAVHLQTYINGPDTVQAYLLNGIPGQQGFPHGVPYTQQPSGIQGYYRYSLGTTDTALLIVTFSKNGVLIDSNLFKIRGTGTQNTFVPFSFSFTVPSVPDSMCIAATSSNFISFNGIQNGSWLELDSLSFTGNSITQQIANGDFENWTPSTIYNPVGWAEGNSSNNNVLRTSSSYSGTYAIELETISRGPGDTSSAIITNGLSGNFGPYGGRPYNQTSDTLCGYYKYIATGDTANVWIQLKQGGNNIGGGGLFFNPTNSYTFFEVPFSSMSTPDTLLLSFQSSNCCPYSANAVGSKLYIDNIWLKSQPLGIPSLNNRITYKCFVYPNPSENILNVGFSKDLNTKVDFKIYDVSGRLVSENEFNGTIKPNTINISNLNSGIYFYEVLSDNGTIRNKFIKE